MDITSYLLGKNASGGGGGGGLDWSAIGYKQTPQHVTDIYNEIDNDYAYSKSIKDNWVSTQSLENKFSGDTTLKYMPLVDTSITTSFKKTFYNCANLYQIPLLDTSNVTDMYQSFRGCGNITFLPQLDTSKVTTFYQCFWNCYELKDFPVLDFSSVTNFSGMFSNDLKLTTQSLDNILQSCVSATSYAGTKTLAQLSINSNSYPASTIQALPHYQDFIDAGWTIGY